MVASVVYCTFLSLEILGNRWVGKDVPGTGLTSIGRRLCILPEVSDIGYLTSQSTAEG